ncbi:hypothetical protein IQ61_22185 [Streptomyces scabiei]|nr:hypothetical protein IQ61_22185 [Streptomyces scabiei]
MVGDQLRVAAVVPGDGAPATAVRADQALRAGEQVDVVGGSFETVIAGRLLTCFVRVRVGRLRAVGIADVMVMRDLLVYGGERGCVAVLSPPARGTGDPASWRTDSA